MEWGRGEDEKERKERKKREKQVESVISVAVMQRWDRFQVPLTDSICPRSWLGREGPRAESPPSPLGHHSARSRPSLARLQSSSGHHTTRRAARLPSGREAQMSEASSRRVRSAGTPASGDAPLPPLRNAARPPANQHPPPPPPPHTSARAHLTKPSYTRARLRTQAPWNNFGLIVAISLFSLALWDPSLPSTPQDPWNTFDLIVFSLSFLSLS